MFAGRYFGARYFAPRYFERKTGETGIYFGLYYDHDYFPSRYFPGTPAAAPTPTPDTTTADTHDPGYEAAWKQYRDTIKRQEYQASPEYAAAIAREMRARLGITLEEFEAEAVRQRALAEYELMQDDEEALIWILH